MLHRLIINETGETTYHPSEAIARKAQGRCLGRVDRVGLHIEGRRWFQRTYDNTYCKAYIFLDGALHHVTEYEYGYRDYFLQAAGDWMQKEWGFGFNGTRELREMLGGSYSVVDITRKKDL